MRIALQDDIPGLVETLNAMGSGIEAFATGSTGSPQQSCHAEVLLCAATGSGDLASLIEHCKGSHSATQPG